MTISGSKCVCLDIHAQRLLLHKSNLRHIQRAEMKCAEYYYPLYTIFNRYIQSELVLTSALLVGGYILYYE